MRRPRRARYAAPIVITLAAAGCAPAPEPVHPNPPAPMPVHPNPPPPERIGPPHTVNPPPVRPLQVAEQPATTHPIAVNPPPRKPDPELPAPSGNGRVEKQADGTCVEYFGVPSCPQGVMCNPPPPRKVRCP